MNKISDRSLKYLSFIQAFSLLVYIGFISFILANGNRWFGKIPNYLGPLLFLTLFSTSALICGVITLYFPFVIFWYKKQADQALKLVFYFIRWLILFTLFIFVFIFLS